MNAIAMVTEPVTRCVSYVSDAELYRQMADEFGRAVNNNPGFNRCVLALKVAARALGVPRAELCCSDKGSRSKKFADQRHKAMAFCRFILRGYRICGTPCGPVLIGRAFCRDHSCVSTAWRKFGRDVSSALGSHHDQA